MAAVAAVAALSMRLGGQQQQLAVASWGCPDGSGRQLLPIVEVEVEAHMVSL